MSYCRMGEDSDVYVIATFDPRVQKKAWQCYCQPTSFKGKRRALFYTREEMLEHLYQHRKDGDKVPEHAVERLLEEIGAG